MSEQPTEHAALSDFYTVDRSHLLKVPVPSMSPDVEVIEGQLSEYRKRATWTDKRDAWQILRQAHAARVETPERERSSRGGFCA